MRMQHKTYALRGRDLPWFPILCKHEKDLDRTKKQLMEQRWAISIANSIARASAVKIDDL